MNVIDSPPHLDTPGRIATKLGVPLWRVQYVIATRKIAPLAFAGRIRLFDREAVSRIRHALIGIDARAAAKGGGADD